MKIENASITLLVGQEETTIEIRDNSACVTFCKVTLTPEQLSSALSRLALTKCSADVFGLDRIGKRHENSRFKFEIPYDLRFTKNYERIRKIGQDILDMNGEGWVLDKYFESQDSFINDGEKLFANGVIRRWGDKISNDE